MKPQRFYRVIDGTAYVYDHPNPDQARSVSIVPASELAYYRANFCLRRCDIRK